MTTLGLFRVGTLPLRTTAQLCVAIALGAAAGRASAAQSAPSPLAPAIDPGETITFDWSNVTGAASYTLQIDDADEFPSPFVLQQTVTVSQFSTSTLPTRTMWWRVRANDGAGNPGNWSSVRRVEVKD